MHKNDFYADIYIHEMDRPNCENSEALHSLLKEFYNGKIETFMRCFNNDSFTNGYYRFVHMQISDGLIDQLCEVIAQNFCSNSRFLIKCSLLADSESLTIHEFDHMREIYHMEGSVEKGKYIKEDDVIRKGFPEFDRLCNDRNIVQYITNDGQLLYRKFAEDDHAIVINGNVLVDLRNETPKEERVYYIE